MSGQVAMSFLSVFLLFLACSTANPTTEAVSSKAWLLEFSVEYSHIVFNPAKNNFLALASNPQVFDVIDVTSGTPDVSLRFTLPLPGQMLAVDPNGCLAAVAHNSYVSFIVLGATVPYMNTFTVPIVQTSGIVVVDNKACIWPSYGQSTNIVCVSANGTYERCSYSIYGGALAFLHPNRKWVYSPNTRLYPQSVHKFMVNPTCVDRLWKNPGHGDYRYGRHWWFSYDGSRAFVDNGMTVSASDDQNTDMHVHGYFNASTRNNPHIWISQSSGDQYYIAGLKSDTSHITLYTWPYLMPTQTLPFPVPKDPRATNPQPLQVHYADDGRLYTVGKYGQGGEIWGLGYIEFNGAHPSSSPTPDPCSSPIPSSSATPSFSATPSIPATSMTSSSATGNPISSATGVPSSPATADPISSVTGVHSSPCLFWSKGFLVAVLCLLVLE